MTREEAIRILKSKMDGSVDTSYEWAEALKMAIEALQDDWIPVSEPPKENGNYIVSLEDAVDTSTRFFNGKWFMSSIDAIAREYGKYEVVAWKPLPKPYRK